MKNTTMVRNAIIGMAAIMLILAVFNANNSARVHASEIRVLENILIPESREEVVPEEVQTQYLLARLAILHLADADEIHAQKFMRLAVAEARNKAAKKGSSWGDMGFVLLPGFRRLAPEANFFELQVNGHPETFVR